MSTDILARLQGNGEPWTFAEVIAEIERLRAALKPLLSREARQRILEEIEISEEMDDRLLAADLQILLDGDTKRRAALVAS